MFEAPQMIDLIFADKRHYFYIYRYTTDQELLAALHTDKITDSNAYEKGVIAYTDCYPALKDGQYNPEAGRMYLLDKSVDTLAHEAVHMALSILSRAGYKNLGVTYKEASKLEEKLCRLVGKITSELYSKSKHF